MSSIDWERKPGSRQGRPNKQTRRKSYMHNYNVKQAYLKVLDKDGEVVEKFNMNKKGNWNSVAQLQGCDDVMVIECPYVGGWGERNQEEIYMPKVKQTRRVEAKKEEEEGVKLEEKRIFVVDNQ
jgi:hypothetical protein